MRFCAGIRQDQILVLQVDLLSLASNSKINCPRPLVGSSARIVMIDRVTWNCENFKKHELSSPVASGSGMGRHCGRDEIAVIARDAVGGRQRIGVVRDKKIASSSLW